jgi:subtilisin family serine protease
MKQTYAILYKARPVIRKGRRSADRIAEDTEPGATRLEFDDSLDEKAAAEATRSEAVEAIAPVMDTVLVEPLAAASEGSGEPWGVSAIGADTCKYDGKGVVAAILDTGIDASHDCFKGIKFEQKDFTGGDDVTSAPDRRGHGTHCAGIFFGRNVDGKRYGVAPGIEKAFIGKVLGDDGRGSTQMLFDGLKWAIDSRAEIISMSLGLDFPGRVKQFVESGMPIEIATSRGLDDFRRTIDFFNKLMGLVESASGFNQVSLVIAASGNQSMRDKDPSHVVFTSVPAVTSDISVAALARKDGRYAVAPFSNARPTLAAPGVDILSAWPGGEFRSQSGTSIACPHVAGAAAIWLQCLRKTGAEATRKTLLSQLVARTDRDLLAPGASPADFGSGLVRVPGNGF